MRTRLSSFLLMGAIAATIAGCSSPTGPSSALGTFSAKINGTQFTSDALFAAAQVDAVGRLTLRGTQVSGTNTTSVFMSIGFIQATEGVSYDLGMNMFTSAGGTGGISTTSSNGFTSHSTPLDGARGTVKIEKLNSTEIAGSFSFTAEPATQGSTGTKTVTNGVFHLALSGFTPQPASNPGSNIKATLGGTLTNEATVVGGGGSTTQFSISGSTSDKDSATLSFLSLSVSSGNVVAGQSFPIKAPAGGGTFVSISLLLNGVNYGGGATGDSGTVQVDSTSNGRVTGSFSGTLSRVGGGSPITVSGGTFNVKIN